MFFDKKDAWVLIPMLGKYVVTDILNKVVKCSECFRTCNDEITFRHCEQSAFPEYFFGTKHPGFDKRLLRTTKWLAIIYRIGAFS